MWYFMYYMPTELNKALTYRTLYDVCYEDLPLERLEGVVFDLGCGLSDIGAELAEGGIPATVFGFDESPMALQESSGNNPVTKLILAKIDNIPAPNESADAIVASWSMPMWAETAEEVTGFYKECNRVLKGGGMLVIAPVPNEYDLKGYRQNEAESWRIQLASKAGADAIRNSSSWLSLSEDDKAVVAVKQK